MKLEWNLGALADGLRCYRSQEFFLAHELWESVWLKCQEPEKGFARRLCDGCRPRRGIDLLLYLRVGTVPKAIQPPLDPFPYARGHPLAYNETFSVEGADKESLQKATRLPTDGKEAKLIPERAHAGKASIDSIQSDT
jgi:hypothetical protein